MNRAELALREGAGARRLEAEHLAHQAVALAEVAGDVTVAIDALGLAARCARGRSLSDASALLERALQLAERHGIVGRRVGLLNELGTIDMLAFADGGRLERARDAALAVGALDIAAGAQLNLASMYTMRDELSAARSAAHEARVNAVRLGLRPLAAAAMVIEALTYGFVGDRDELERRLRMASELSPRDADLHAFAWGAGRGLCSLVREDRQAARESFARARRADAPIGVLDTARAPLLLLAAVDGNATDRDREDAQEVAVPGAGWSDLWLGYADAVLHGAAGRVVEAADAFDTAEVAARRHPLFRAIGLRLVSEAALRDGWGDPAGWLRDAEASFVASGRDRIATACRALLKQAGVATTRRRGADRRLSAALLAAGVTAREAEVLDLVAERLGNKEIAERLYLSSRTVEKHVASLLAKLGAGNRAELARRDLPVR